MLTRGRVVLVIATIIVLLAGLLAWQYWPLALRYRQDRTLQAGRAAVRRYITGQDSLPRAICRLATEIRRYNDLSMRLSEMEPGQTKRIEDKPLFVPLGTDPNDPRVEEVTRNAYRLTVPEDLPQEVRAQLMRLNDSMLRARGYRIVECAA